MHGIAWYNASVQPSGMQGIPGAGKVPYAWGICSLPSGGVHEQHPELGRPEGPNQGPQAIWKSPQARGPFMHCHHVKFQNRRWNWKCYSDQET